MRLGLCTAVAILALSFMAPATAEETFEERYARFQLFANCTPMDLYVWVSSEAEEIGLKATSVRAAAESRLRSARLYDSEMSFPLCDCKCCWSFLFYKARRGLSPFFRFV